MGYRGPSWSWVSTKAAVEIWTHTEITLRLTLERPISLETWSWVATTTLTPSSSAQGSRPQPLLDQRAAAPDIVSCTVGTYGKNKSGEISSAVLIIDGYLKESRVWRESTIPDSAVPPSFQVGVERGAETGPSGSFLWNVPFFADYILSTDGQYGYSSSGVHFLLSISTNICLVLSKTPLRLSRDTSIFRRIVILRIPYYTYRYGVDFMRGSQKTRVAII